MSSQFVANRSTHHRSLISFWLTATLLLFVMMFAGCGGDDGDDDGGNPLGPGPSPSPSPSPNPSPSPSPSPSPTPAGPISATVGGQAWTSDADKVTAETLPSPGGFFIEGRRVSGGDEVIVQLTLFNIGGPGTYPLGVNPTVFGGAAQVGSTAGVWQTPGSGLAGSVTITVLTSTRIAGTFEFTAVAAYGGATGTKAVTNGQFDLTFTGTVTPMTARSGSRVGATLGGNAWNAATVVSTYNNNFLAVGGDNNQYTIVIFVSPLTAPGTYDLGVGLNTFQVTHLASGDTWGGAGTTGTITITSLNADRVVGTFQATLPPTGTATSSLEVQTGSFDIGFYQ